MQDAHRKESSTSVDHTCTCFTTDQEKKAGQKEYHPTDTINNSANRHNKNPGSLRHRLNASYPSRDGNTSATFSGFTT